MNALLRRCSQPCCRKLPTWRYTWPGRQEAAICDEHVGHLRMVTEMLRLHVGLQPLKLKPKTERLPMNIHISAQDPGVLKTPVRVAIFISREEAQELLTPGSGLATPPSALFGVRLEVCDDPEAAQRAYEEEEAKQQEQKR